jgi:hypothetical protein
MNIGTTNATTINMGNTGSFVNIYGNTTAGGGITLNSGTNGYINIGTGFGGVDRNNTIDIGGSNGANSSSTVNIGNTPNNYQQVINIGANGSGSNSGNNTVHVQGGNGAGAIALDTASGGQITLGNTSNAYTQTIKIGVNTTGGATSNVTIGSTLTSGSTVIQGGNLSETITNNTDTINTTTTSTTTFVVQNNGANYLAVDTTDKRIIVGPTAGDTNGELLVLGNKTNAVDPTGVNGAIYFNQGGTGGPAVSGSFGGVFRCYQNGAWQDCIGAPDLSQRRWGYASMASPTATSLSNIGMLTTLSTSTASCVTTTAPTVTADDGQAESQYVSYATANVAGDCGGLNPSAPATFTTETEWLPRMETRIRLGGAISANRYWAALTSSSLNNDDANGGDATKLAGFRYDTNIGGETTWKCVSGDGTTASSVDTGVTVTANHYYDMIVDLSNSGMLVCSISDNGGAFTTVTKSSNLPGAATQLWPEESVTTVSGNSRTLEVEYLYLDQK